MNKKYSADEMAPVIEELLSHGKKVNLTVTGNSMYPLFRNRLDTVVLEKSETYKKNDIVFYKRDNGQYVLHRIIKVRGNAFVLAGDNETVKEFPVYKNIVMAKVTEAQRGRKTLDFSAVWYRFYCFVWISLFFLRKILLKVVKTLAKSKCLLYNKVE